MNLHLLSRTDDSTALSVIREMGPAVVVALSGKAPELPPGFTSLTVVDSASGTGTISWADLTKKVFEAEKVYGW